MNSLYIAFIIWAVGLPFLFSIGINSIRYARILRLDWPIYVEAAFWMILAMLSLIRLVASIYVLATTGPGPDYKGVGYLSTVNLTVGGLFVIFLAIGKYVAVRNARMRSESERKAAAETHNAIFSLKQRLEPRFANVRSHS